MIRIERDKWKHFAVGILMGITLQIFSGYVMPGHFVLSVVTSFILVVAISYGFELFSLFTGKGHYELLDAVAGTIGGIVGIAIILIFS